MSLVELNIPKSLEMGFETPHMVIDLDQVKIEELLSKPESKNSQWCSELKETVNSLDSIEPQFMDYDRSRFGGTVSRDLIITNVKNEYRDIFQE